MSSFDVDLFWCIKDGSTPLMASCQMNHLNVLGVLLSHGAEVNATMVDGTTGIFIAAQNGFTDVVRQLLTIGHADPLSCREVCSLKLVDLTKSFIVYYNFSSIVHSCRIENYTRRNCLIIRISSVIKQENIRESNWSRLRFSDWSKWKFSDKLLTFFYCLMMNEAINNRNLPYITDKLVPTSSLSHREQLHPHDSGGFEVPACWLSLEEGPYPSPVLRSGTSFQTTGKENLENYSKKSNSSSQEYWWPRTQRQSRSSQRLTSQPTTLQPRRWLLLS